MFSRPTDGSGRSLKKCGNRDGILLLGWLKPISSLLKSDFHTFRSTNEVVAPVARHNTEEIFGARPKTAKHYKVS